MESRNNMDLIETPPKMINKKQSKSTLPAIMDRNKSTQ